MKPYGNRRYDNATNKKKRPHRHHRIAKATLRAARKRARREIGDTE